MYSTVHTICTELGILLSPCLGFRAPGRNPLVLALSRSLLNLKFRAFAFALSSSIAPSHSYLRAPCFSRSYLCARAAKFIYSKDDIQERTGTTGRQPQRGQAEQDDDHCGTGRIGQAAGPAEQDRQYKTTRTGLPGQNYQYRIAKTGLPGHDS
jgi:hypothetical protein